MAFFQTSYPGVVGVLSSLRTITTAHVIFCQQQKQQDIGVATGAKISGPISKFSPLKKIRPVAKWWGRS